MSNFIISQIRTYVPIIVGAALAWITKETGFIVGDDMTESAVILLTGFLSAVYYGVIHWLEQRFPQVGWLLGKATLPYYDVIPPPDDAYGVQGVDVPDAGAVELSVIESVLRIAFFVTAICWFFDNAGWLD